MKNLLPCAGIFLFFSMTSMAQETQTDSLRELNEIVITGRYYQKYTTNDVSSTLRVKTPLQQLPQNIQTINSDVILDQGSFNMTDAVTRNVSGLVRQEVSNNLGPYIFMRGGQVSSFRNGVDLTAIYRGPSPDDAAIIDRVEFVKGPSLFMNNIGDPAGSFNVVTKQPTGSEHYSVSAMAGSWNFYRILADMDGVIGKSKKLQYRLDVMGMKSRSFVKSDFNNRLLIAPVIKYQLNDHSYISGEYIFQKFKYAMQSPIVMSPNGFASLPTNFTIHETSLTPYTPTDQNAFFTYNNQLNEKWSVTARFSYLQNDSEGTYMWVTSVNEDDSQILLRNPKYDLTRFMVFSEQAFINGSFTTGSVHHNLLAGVDVNQKEFYADSYVQYDTATDGSLNYYALDINNPVYGADVPNYSTPGGVKNGNTHQTANYISGYVMDELLLFQDKLRLTVGLRGTKLNTRNTVSGTVTSTDDLAFTPRTGFSYSITKDFSVYGLFDKTFQAQTGVQGVAQSSGDSTVYTAGDAVSPLLGRVFEIGLKKDWMRGRVSTTVAVYTIERQNISESIPSTSYKTQIGESRSSGIDVDIKGELAKGLNVIVNYAYNDSKVIESETESLVGARTAMYVKHIQNTWVNYTLPIRGALKGFGISAGYQYMGGRGERYSTATPTKVPDYFRMDVGVNWRNQHFAVNLLVNNVTDKNSIGTPWYRNGLYYWVPNAPRNFRLSLTYDI